MRGAARLASSLVLVLVLALGGASGHAAGQQVADSVTGTRTARSERDRDERKREDGLLEEADLDEASIDAADLEAALDDLRALEPVALNTASADRLARIPTLDPLAAARIVAFRRAYGPFERIADLKAVRGMDEETLRRTAPFLRLDPPIVRAAPSGPGPVHRIRTRTLQRVDRRLDLGEGYRSPPEAGGYTGSPVRLVSRLRIRVGDRIRLGATGEKDPGEPMVWDPTQRLFGYDHGSGYLAWTGPGGRRFVLGDYRLGFGQRLLLGGGYSLGKTGGVSGAGFGSGEGLRPSGSTSESGFFRGAAAAARISESLEAWGFLSRRRYDGVSSSGASAPDSTEGGAPAGVDSVGTIRTSGLHRTLLETAPRRTLLESTVGGALEGGRGPLRVSALIYRTRFRPPIAPSGRSDLRFAFRGETAVLASTSASLLLPDVHLFGELGRGPGGATAGLIGGLLGLGESSELALHLRRYPARFWSPHGGAFAEQSGKPGNEHGLYAGIRLRPIGRWTVRAYVDQFRFPWLRYGTPRPSSGHEAYLRVARTDANDRELLVQVRSKLREESVEAATGTLLLRTVRARIRQTARLQWTERIRADLRLRLRTEVARSHDVSAAHGLAGFADLRWTPRRSLRIDVRGTWFRTDGYAARIYQLESDLYYAFRAPALFGRGRRAYLLVSWYPTDGLQLQAKYGLTRVFDRDRLGSGWEELRGNRLREVRAQLRWTRIW